MHLIIIYATPNKVSVSNTVRYSKEFIRGFMRHGGSVEEYYLSERNQWKSAISAFLCNNHILFALPVYNAMIPGIMMEFLETLSQNLQEKNAESSLRNITFLLQSGFPESIHRKCCESYLKKLPSLLNSQFSGTLSHGNTFQINFSNTNSVHLTYETMGELFAKHECTFFFSEAEDFNTPVQITDTEAKMYNRIFRFFCQHTAQARECKQPLDYKPYH